MKAPERDVAVLVVKQAAGTLRVLSSARVKASDLGKAATRSGAGRSTHRWRLVGPQGVEDSGVIAAREDIHVPPEPASGEPAGHGVPSEIVFTARVPYPLANERIEIEPMAPSVAKQAIWP